MRTLMPLLFVLALMATLPMTSEGADPVSEGVPPAAIAADSTC